MMMMIRVKFWAIVGCYVLLLGLVSTFVATAQRPSNASIMLTLTAYQRFTNQNADTLNTMNTMRTMMAKTLFPNNSFPRATFPVIVVTATPQRVRATATPSAGQAVLPEPTRSVRPTPSRPSEQTGTVPVLLDLTKWIDLDGLIAASIVVVAIWAGGWLLIDLVGRQTSKMVLSRIHETYLQRSATTSALDQLFMQFYRLIIWLAAGYFYLSLPVLVWVMLCIYINVNRVIALTIVNVIILGGTSYTLFFMLRSIAVGLNALRRREPIQEQPENLLPRDANTPLWQLVEEIAQQLNTRPIDLIYLRANATLGVYEFGSFWTRLRGRGQRVLIIGIWLLNYLSEPELRAAIAHEYGHFINQDTNQGGRVALDLRLSALMIIKRVAEYKYNNLFNPIWMFVLYVLPTIHRITQGASRFQEIIADRTAAALIGAVHITNCLQNLVFADLMFKHLVIAEIQLAEYEGRLLRNIYELPPLPEEQMQKIVFLTKEEIEQPTSIYDSHPAISDRIALLKPLIPANQPIVVGGKSWHLLPDAAAWQLKMTQQIQRGVMWRGREQVAPKDVEHYFKHSSHQPNS
jgi:Zn-dependent protease with chaperone function